MFYILNKNACLLLVFAKLLLSEGMAWKHVLWTCTLQVTLECSAPHLLPGIEPNISWEGGKAGKRTRSGARQLEDMKGAVP